ncbi:MAG: hypothetical protein D6705_18385 [Deltaproteobacteria bacterium]|nr:MAG: hypothetical protein D6705_18385 [Deltaproteobacteria bacterium]
MLRNVHRLGVLFACALPACGGGAKDGAKSGGGAERGAEQAARPEAGGGTAPSQEEPGLAVAAGDEIEQGPLPPNSDMVLFVNDGGLLPLGCFRAEDKKIETGTKCLDMVPDGAEVRLGTTTSTAKRKVTGRVEPLCLAGSGKKVALSAEGLGGGASYVVAVYPPPTYRAVTLVPEETKSEKATKLAEDVRAQWRAALSRLGAPQGAVEAVQVARVDVDGNGVEDLFAALVIPDPANDERYRYSGALLAPDGDIAKAVQVERSKRREDVFELRGVVDLDGDGRRELWLRMNFAEGGGDRLVRLDGSKAVPLGRWTCGV